MKRKSLLCLFIGFLVSIVFGFESFAYQVARTDYGRIIRWAAPSMNYVVNPNRGPAGST